LFGPIDVTLPVGQWTCAFAHLLWQGVIWITGEPTFISPSPSPSRVAEATLANRDLIAESAAVTAAEVAPGRFIGNVLVAVTAIQLASSARLHRLVMPLLIISFKRVPSPFQFAGKGAVSDHIETNSPKRTPGAARKRGGTICL
tara:strand:+ start:763 stop:1194 length:432 start_codon:yes stop_codon:yes gene_type:complete